MGRMDKYEEGSTVSYSRTRKNEDLYKDVYLNNTLIDFNKIVTLEDEIINEEQEPVIEFKTINYTEKEYNLNKYLEEKRALHQKDNRPRSLNEEIKKSDDEINELVSKIESEEVKEILLGKSILDRRLIHAYPNLKAIINQKKEEIKRKTEAVKEDIKRRTKR